MTALSLLMIQVFDPTSGIRMDEVWAFDRGVDVDNGFISICANPNTNSIAIVSNGATIAGGGSTEYPNIIGSESGATPNVSTIGGGYDNKNDQLAGTIAGGAHHFLHKEGDHGSIGGGSYCEITGGHYGTIGGGTLNVTSADNATVGGGTKNTASGVSSTVVGGSVNVSSGAQSTVMGSDCTAAGNNSVVGGVSCVGGGTGAIVFGSTNTTSTTSTRGDFSGILSGFTNSLGSVGSARFGVIAGGRDNTIDTGEYACIIGGRDCHVTIVYGQATGYQAVSSIYGSRAWAVGSFSADGDAQRVDLMARIETTNDTPTPMTINGADAIVVPASSSWAFSIKVTARRTNTTLQSAAYFIRGLIHRGTGVASTAIVGQSTEAFESDAAWDVAVTANTSTGALVITVTGVAATTIRWNADISLNQVTGVVA